MGHLSSLPKCFQLEDVPDHTFSIESHDKRYFKKFRWMNFSRLCTAPVEPDDDRSIVIGAQLLVEKSGLNKVLFLRLQFCTVLGTIILRHSEWDESSGVAPQLGAMPAFINRRAKEKTSEKKIGLEDPPSYWVVSGARLVERGKIALRLKHSLLSAILPEDNTPGGA
ncbi:hypothetical protein DITRI_Ditri01bG0010800 [Diplodiscus trichospermus]